MVNTLKILMEQDKQKKDWIIKQLDNFESQTFYAQMRALDMSRLIDDKKIEQYIRSTFQSEFFHNATFDIELEKFQLKNMRFRGERFEVVLSFLGVRTIRILSVDEPVASKDYPEDYQLERRFLGEVRRLLSREEGGAPIRVFADVIERAGLTSNASEVASRLRKTGLKKWKQELLWDYIHEIEKKVEYSNQAIQKWESWRNARLLFESTGQYFLDEIKADLERLERDGAQGEVEVGWTSHWYEASKLEQKLERVKTRIGNRTSV